jgi:mutator protein MutT
MPDPDAASALIEVVAAVIERAGRILVTRRPAGTHLAGLWEFPGGKPAPGESPEEALVREIREELGARATVGGVVETVDWTYPDKRVRIVFFRCGLEGEPRPLEGQEMRWVAPQELTALEFPAADATLVAHLVGAGEPHEDGVPSPFAQLVTFLPTRSLAATHAFYADTLGLPLALDQGACRIYQVAPDGYIGFCESATAPERPGDTVTVTLVTDEVDAWAARLRSRGVVFEKEPQANPRFSIYHCFLRDPSGYLVEIQRFEDPRWPRPASREAVRERPSGA